MRNFLCNFKGKKQQFVGKRIKLGGIAELFVIYFLLDDVAVVAVVLVVLSSCASCCD